VQCTKIDQEQLELPVVVSAWKLALACSRSGYLGWLNIGRGVPKAAMAPTTSRSTAQVIGGAGVVKAPITSETPAMATA
jgi:hypothetical protein